MVCGVPTGEAVVASAEAPGRASGEVALEVPPQGFLLRDLSVGAVGITSPAHAAYDTNWPCAACLTVSHSH